jgi:hypothetical protein
MVEAVLAVEPFNHTLCQGLNYNYRTIEIGLLVHVPDNPINESAQEVSFAKLNNFLRHHALWSEMFV